MMVLLGIVGIVIGLWLTDWLRRILMGDDTN
jgi:xanthosine utilization system XapX-like protein